METKGRLQAINNLEAMLQAINIGVGGAGGGLEGVTGRGVAVREKGLEGEGEGECERKNNFHFSYCWLHFDTCWFGWHVEGHVGIYTTFNIITVNAI